MRTPPASELHFGEVLLFRSIVDQKRGVFLHVRREKREERREKRRKKREQRKREERREKREERRREEEKKEQSTLPRSKQLYIKTPDRPRHRGCYVSINNISSINSISSISSISGISSIVVLFVLAV